MNKQHKQNGGQDTQPDMAATVKPGDTIDYEEFSEFFEDEDITEEQAREFLQIYWSLALEIMSLGFGFHPVQQAQESCGKNSVSPDALPVTTSDEVYLTDDYITDNFEQAAGPELDRAGKDSPHDAV